MITKTASYANALAEYYANRHKWKDAEIWYRKVNEIRAASEDKYTDMLVPFYAGTYRCIALACWHQGKYQQAEDNFLQDRKLYRQHPERNTWESAAINKDLEICRQDRINHKRIWGTD